MVKRFGRNKKGSVQDLFFVAGIVFFAAFIILIGYKINSEFKNQIDGMDNIPDTAKASTTTLNNYYPGIIDNSFAFIIVFLCLGVLTLAALVRVHPIFIPIFLIVYLLLLFFCGVISNIYQEIASQPALAVEASNLDLILFSMTYLPLIIGVIGIILMVIMYKTWKVATS